MADDIEDTVRAQVAEHLRVQRQLSFQEKMAPAEPGMRHAMLLASPFGKLSRDAEVAVQAPGHGATLAPGLAAAQAQVPAEPGLWVSGLTLLAGLAVLFLGLRRLWE